MIYGQPHLSHDDLGAAIVLIVNSLFIAGSLFFLYSSGFYSLASQRGAEAPLRVDRGKEGTFSTLLGIISLSRSLFLSVPPPSCVPSPILSLVITIWSAAAAAGSKTVASSRIACSSGGNRKSCAAAAAHYREHCGGTRDLHRRRRRCRSFLMPHLCIFVQSVHLAQCRRIYGRRRRRR